MQPRGFSEDEKRQAERVRRKYKKAAAAATVAESPAAVPLGLVTPKHRVVKEVRRLGGRGGKGAWKRGVKAEGNEKESKGRVAEEW